MPKGIPILPKGISILPKGRRPEGRIGMPEGRIGLPAGIFEGRINDPHFLHSWNWHSQYTPGPESSLKIFIKFLEIYTNFFHNIKIRRTLTLIFLEESRFSSSASEILIFWQFRGWKDSYEILIFFKKLIKTSKNCQKRCKIFFEDEKILMRFLFLARFEAEILIKKIHIKKILLKK